MSLCYAYIALPFYFTINSFILIMTGFLLLVLESTLALSIIEETASFVAVVVDVVAVSFILRNYKD